MYTNIVYVPENVNVEINDNIISVSSGANKESKVFYYPGIKIEKKEKEIIFSFEKKALKRMVFTLSSHLKSMFKGVTKGFEYTLKTCYTHFPIKVSIEEKKIVVNNFYGEKKPRCGDVIGNNTKIKIEGNDITVTGTNLGEVSQTAANFEKVTRVTKRDRRVFQDGIYITKKGK